jgi:hypothetical protein
MCFSWLQLVVPVRFLNQVPRDGVAMPSATSPYLSSSSVTVPSQYCSLWSSLFVICVCYYSSLGGFAAVKRNLKNTGYFERTELVRSLQNISESSEQGKPVRDSHRLTLNESATTLRRSYHLTECQE